MHFNHFGALAAASLAAASPAHVAHVERLPRNLMPRVVDPQPLSARASADFPLTWSANNQTLYHGKVGDANANVVLDVECVECWTKGTVSASLTDPDITDPHVRLDFSGVGAHADMSITANGALSYTINLFESETPFGIGYDGFDAGLVFFVDLVFSLSDTITFEGGFEVDIPDGSYVEVDILSDGDVADSQL